MCALQRHGAQAPFVDRGLIINACLPRVFLPPAHDDICPVACDAADTNGDFDGQGSGHDFYGTLYMPPTGFINNCDGGRSHTYCDYRQQ